MALDLSGDAVPIALLGDPFATQIVLASQTGAFSKADNSMNPLDLFSAYRPMDFWGTYPTVPGVAVLILNAAGAPLQLLEAINPFDNSVPPRQVSYPVVYDSEGKPTRVHEIPGTRTYPRPAKHQRVRGGPELLAGVGVYRFFSQTYRGNSPNPSNRFVDCAMRFSCSADGKGPQIGLAFGAEWPDGSPQKRPSAYHWAITGDVAQYGDLNGFYQKTAGATSNNAYDVGPAPSGLAIWGSFPSAQNAAPVIEPHVFTFTVWVRDPASTIGF